MDLSKLPKLSQTPAPPGQRLTGVNERGGSCGGRAGREGGVVLPVRGADHAGDELLLALRGELLRGGRRRCRAGRAAGMISPGGMWVEAFLSIAIGVVLLLLSPGGIKNLSATLVGGRYTPYAHPDDRRRRVAITFAMTRTLATVVAGLQIP